MFATDTSFANFFAKLAYRYPLLFGGIAVANGYRIVFKRLVVNSDTERRTNQVLAGITLANGCAVVVHYVEIEFQLFVYFFALFRPGHLFSSAAEWLL